MAIPVLDEDKKILSEVLDLLDVMAATGMALASGYIDVSETKIIFSEARKRGVEHLNLAKRQLVGAQIAGYSINLLWARRRLSLHF